MSNDHTIPEGPTDPRLAAAPPADDATSIVPGFGPPPDQSGYGPPPDQPGYGQATELAYGPGGSPTAVVPSAPPAGPGGSPTAVIPPPQPPGPPGSPAAVQGAGGRVYGGTTTGGPGAGTGDSTQEQPAAPVSPSPPVSPAAPAPPKAGSERGRTTITDEVVERVIKKVVDLVVEEVDGVHGLYVGDEPGFLAADDGDGAPGSGPVGVRLDDGRATINLSIEVDFGHAVHDVVDAVRASVISRTERLLGLTVAQVDVVVAEVAFDIAE